MEDRPLFHASQVPSQYGVIVEKTPKKFYLGIAQKAVSNIFFLFFFLLENVDAEKTG